MITRRCFCQALALSPLPTLASSVETISADIVIVGSGGAGLCAACAAIQAGAKNIFLAEKSPTVGGHTILSAGTVAAVWPKLQKPQGIDDSWELMASQMIAIGKTNDPSLVRVLCQNSGASLQWMEDLGVRWRKDVRKIFGCPNVRGFKTNNARSGFDYIIAALNFIKKNNVNIFTNTELTSIELSPAGTVGGAIFTIDGNKAMRVKTKKLILSTGGFTANRELLTNFAPDVTSEMRSSANPKGLLYDGCDGQAMIEASLCGARLLNLDAVQIIPMGGGRTELENGVDIWLNSHGERFVKEGCPWKELKAAIDRQGASRLWVLSAPHGSETENIESKLLDGSLKIASSWDELASILQLPKEKIRQTVSEYNDSVSGKISGLIDVAESARPLSGPPFYIGPVNLAVHTTLGGIAINTRSEVVKSNGEPIPGLYAAGEVTGGLHGQDKMAGTGMTENFVFGRIAGTNAANSI